MTTGTVFTNNRTQAVRLPTDVRLPESVKKVSIRIRGRERVIAPVEHTWDYFFLHGPRATDDFMEDRGHQMDTPRESF